MTKKADKKEVPTTAGTEEAGVEKFKKLLLAMLPAWKSQLLDARQSAENSRYVELTGKIEFLDFLAQEIMNAKLPD